MNTKTAFFLSFLVILPSLSKANDKYCPNMVGYLHANPFAEQVLKNVKTIYEKLGCETNFVGYPSNRVIMLFNRGKLDGDIIRGQIAEKNFTTDYIRSEYPLYSATKVIWSAKDRQENKPIGYLKGVKWQEEFVPLDQQEKMKFIGFSDHKSMINAYNRGVIDSFLFLRSPIDKLADTIFTRTRPEISSIIDEMNLYHYLNANFSDFMEDLNQVLRKTPKT